jgi:ankyrin repeat protein
VVEFLLKVHPEAIDVETKFGLLPLHYACGYEQSLDVVKHLVLLRPSAVKVAASNEKRLPLHYACSKSSAPGVIPYLLEQHPEAAAMPTDREEWLPLHFACRSGLCVENIDSLLKAFPNAVKHANRYKELPLHTACRCHPMRVDLISSLVELYPEACGVTSNSLHFSNKRRGDKQIFPLMRLCEEKAPLEVVKLVYEKYPEAAKIPEEQDGKLPLHQACRWEAPREVVEFLLNVYPAGAEILSEKAMSPLHYACGNNQDLAIVRRLLELYPDALKVANTEDGRLPLHFSCALTPADGVVLCLLNAYPEAARQPSTSGYLPLHYACRSGQPTTTLHDLIRVNPQALQYRSLNEDFPLHAACRTKPALHVLRMLLEEDPDTLQSEPSPIMLALESEASATVIDFLESATARASELSKVPRSERRRILDTLLPSTIVNPTLNQFPSQESGNYPSFKGQSQSVARSAQNEEQNRSFSSLHVTGQPILGSKLPPQRFPDYKEQVQSASVETRGHRATHVTSAEGLGTEGNQAVPVSSAEDSGQSVVLEHDTVEHPGHIPVAMAVLIEETPPDPQVLVEEQRQSIQPPTANVPQREEQKLPDAEEEMKTPQEEKGSSRRRRRLGRFFKQLQRKEKG